MPEIATESVESTEEKSLVASLDADVIVPSVIVPSVVPAAPRQQPGNHLPKPTIAEVEELNAKMKQETEAKIKKLEEEGIKIVSMEEFTPEKAGIDTKGFIPVGSDLPKNPDGGKSLFSFQNTRYAIYDYDFCAPWGLLQGYLLNFETWVEGGESKHGAVFLPSAPFMVIERSILVQKDGSVIMQAIPRRVRKDDLVLVPLFEAPERLRKYVTPAWAAEMQFRAGSPPPHRNWIVAISEVQKSRASLNLV